jgi:hypothetical protein
VGYSGRGHIHEQLLTDLLDDQIGSPSGERLREIDSKDWGPIVELRNRGHGFSPPGSMAGVELGIVAVAWPRGDRMMEKRGEVVAGREEVGKRSQQQEPEIDLRP